MRAYISRSGMLTTMILAAGLVMVGGVASNTAWTALVAPELVERVMQGDSEDRVLIVQLDVSTAPDWKTAGRGYSLVSHDSWLSSDLKAYWDRLFEVCEPASTWCLQRSGSSMWELTPPYLAFAHAVIVRCPIQEIPSIASLPFVEGVLDGETPAKSSWQAPQGSLNQGITWDVILTSWSRREDDGRNEFAEPVSVPMWTALLETSASTLTEGLRLISRNANEQRDSSQTEWGLVAWSAKSVPESGEAEEDTELPWPHGLSVDSLIGTGAGLTQADLLMCIDAALHVGAEYITLGDDQSSERETALALLWTPVTDQLPVEAVEETGLAAPDASSALLEPVSGVNATQGSHEDRVTIVWESLSDVELYEVLRRSPEDLAYGPIGIAEGTSFSDFDVATCVSFNYRVRAIAEDGVGLESEGSRGFIGEVPDVIEWIRASDGLMTPGIHIEWSSVETAMRYILWRCEPVKAPNQSTTKVYRMYDGPESSFLDLDVVPGTTYRYTAVPFNGCGASPVGNPADQGVAMFAAIPEGSLRPPESLSASLVFPEDCIQVRWIQAPGASEYRVYRAESYQGPYELVHTTSERAWNDTDVVYCQDYWYRIQSRSDSEESVQSAVAHGVCGGKAGQPEDIRVSDGEYPNKIEIAWSPGYAADFYEVFRATTKDGPYALLVRGEALSYVDSGLEPGQTFWYRTQARNACGGSGWTVPIQGETAQH
ncbi:hypothetical protein ACFLSF_00055 [Candidatus Bipolaricaulota bacterium]